MQRPAFISFIKVAFSSSTILFHFSLHFLLNYHEKVKTKNHTKPAQNFGKKLLGLGLLWLDLSVNCSTLDIKSWLCREIYATAHILSSKLSCHLRGLDCRWRPPSSRKRIPCAKSLVWHRNLYNSTATPSFGCPP